MTEPLRIYEELLLDLLNLLDTASDDEINDDIAVGAMDWVAHRLQALPPPAVESLVQQARNRYDTDSRASSAFADLRDALGL